MGELKSAQYAQSAREKIPTNISEIHGICGNPFNRNRLNT
jgi:hypothetical protein